VTTWMDTTNIPVLSIPGNHDFFPADWCGVTGGHFNYEYWIDDWRYLGDFGDQSNHKYWDYKFDYGTFRFIMIDNVQKEDTFFWKDAVQLTAAQRDKIGTWLSDASRTSIVFSHIPLSQVFPGYSEVNWAARNNGARAAFAGHTHDHEYEDPSDCGRYDHFQVLTGCTRWKDQKVDSGFLLVTLYEDVTDGCGFFYKRFKYVPADESWEVAQGYPKRVPELIDKTVNPPCTYHGVNIQVGDLSTPFIVDGLGEVTFEASDSILFRPGFELRNGATMKTNLRDCLKME